MSVFRQLMMRKVHNEANYMDLTVVGSPTISNNVVSNFSTVNYVNSNVPFNPVNGVWEVGIKLTTGDTSQEAIFFRSAISAPANDERYGIALSIQYAQFKAALSFDGNSWVVPPRIITYIVQSNTTYFVKFGWTGSVYYMDFSLDGVTYTRVISYDSSNGIYDGLTITQFGIFSYDNRYELPWLGSIDFNSSYIKLNGVKYQFRFTMPLTKVGSPTITNNIISGFSTSNYFTANKNVNLSTQTVELVFDIKMTDFTSSGLCMFATNNFTIQFFADNNTSFKRINLGGQSATGTKQYELNTNYTIKCLFKVVNGSRQLEIYYLNGNSWVLDVTYTYLSFSSFDTFILGDNYTHSGTRVFKGSYNLNNCYIKIDDTKYMFAV